MIYGFYFRFYKRLHNRILSVILSYIAYSIVFVKFIIKRIQNKKRVVDIDKDSAYELVHELWPDHKSQLLWEASDLDDEIDLSIIVPIYNYVDLIEKNIESVLNQKTRFRFQLIIVDDGSTDGAQNVIKKYETYPNVDIVFQDNQGIAGARNTGLSLAKGKYIMFVDCDDIVEDTMVETLMSKAYSGDFDIVMGAHNLVKERDGKAYDIIPNIYPGYNMLGYHKNAYILNYAGLPWAKVYKRELWDHIRFFTGYWFEDTIIHGLLFTQCKTFSYVPIICYQYRWYEKNFSHIQGKSSNLKNIDYYWLLCAILEKYKELGLPKDECYETMLLKHLSSYYYTKISGLENRVVEALFVLACDLYERYGLGINSKLPYMLRLTKKALQQKDINLWILALKYQK